MMTAKERAMVEKIMKSDYSDGLPLEELINHQIWTFSVSNGPSDNAVIGSMQKKGFVDCGRSDKDETIWLTQKGAEAYTNSCGPLSGLTAEELQPKAPAAKLTAPPLSKAEEKQLLASLIRTLPEGYVRDILQDMKPEIENAIDSDFCYVPFAQRRQEAEAHRLEMLEGAKQRAALKEEVASLERRIQHLQGGLDELRSTVKQLAKI